MSGGDLQGRQESGCAQATRRFALSGRLEPEPTGTRDASKLRGALTQFADNLVDAHSDRNCTRHGAVGGGREWKPERRLENQAFGLRRPRGMAQPTIYCRESEIWLSSAYEQSCRSAGHEPQPRHHSGAANRAESAEKNSFPLLAAQPIDKSRFGRENPRKSKEIQPSDREAFAAKQARVKKTQMDAGQRCSRCREGAKPAPSKGKTP
jgi:hypothetical protein